MKDKMTIKNNGHKKEEKVKQKKNPLEKKMKVYGMSLIDNLDNNMIIQFAESIAKVFKNENNN